MPPPWNSSYAMPLGLRSICLKNWSKQHATPKKALLPPTAQAIGARLIYIHRRPNHWQFWLLRIILSTLVPSDTGNMKPACVISRTPCKNWYADKSIVKATDISCTVSNLRSAPLDKLRRISQSFPVIRVSRDSTVVARNVCAVMAFLRVWTAYNQPSVVLTCLAQSSRVSATCIEVTYIMLSKLSNIIRSDYMQ